MMLRVRLSRLLPRVLLRVLPATSVIMLLVGYATTSAIERSLEQQVTASLEQDSRFGAVATATKLDAILDSIRSVASNDLIINALVDPETREAYVPLYFNQLQIPGLGSNQKISFFDYRGREIASNGQNWAGDKRQDQPWLKKVIRQSEEFMSLDPQGGIFAVPVLHEGVAEGAIVVAFGSAGLATLLPLPLGARAVIITNRRGTLYSSQPQFAGFFESKEDAKSDWLKSSARVPGRGDIKVIVAEPKDVALAAVYDLGNSLYVALSVAIAGLIVSIFLVALLTTRPLSKFAHDLKRVGAAADLDRRIEAEGAIEFQDLAGSINSMLERLQKTVVSHEMLAAENKIRIKAEQEVRDREARNRAIVDTALEGIITIDERGIVESFNPASTGIFGYLPEEVVGKNISMLMPEPYRSQHDGYLRRYVELGLPSAIGVIGRVREVNGLRKNGSEFPMDLAVSPVEVNGKQMFTGMVRDITDRKNFEAAITEQNERFNMALENMSHGVCVFDRDNRLVVSNERYATMYGLTPDSVILGMTAREIVELRVAQGIHAGERAEDYVRDRIDWGRSGDRNNTKIHELSNGRTIRVSRQELSDGGWVTTHEDITEMKRMERLKNEFVSVVSHELRTPLTSLVGSLRLLTSGKLKGRPEKAQSMIEIAYRNTERLMLLVDDILDVEKIKSDQMELFLSPVDLVALAQKAVAENEAYGTGYGVSVRLEHDLGTAYANVDENRMLQVLANLLSNAIKFSSPDSEVVLRVTRQNGTLRLAVVDTGSGIAEDKQARLFDRFFQVDASDSRSKQGTGLGLSIVKAIIERHGGQVHVESQVGKGSTFYFDLNEVDVISHADIDDVNAHQVAISQAS